MPIWRNTSGNFLWGTAANWDTGVLPSATGAGSDAIFDALSPNCTVNITTAVCRNLNFTGYTNTINMANTIIVGSTSAANPGHAVTLSSTMGISGTGSIQTRSNGNINLRSNGRTWPNAFGIVNVALANNPTVTLLDNWTISGNLFIGPGGASVAVTFSGAFTINAGANVTIQATGNNTRIAATSGSLSTIRLTGTGTFSFSGIMGGFGLNLIIDAPGQTVTLGPVAGYGGLGVVTGSTFSYVAGTVVCTGTFYLHFTVLGTATYTLNLFGSTSPSATTTSTSGINFNNLNFRTAGTSGSQTCSISGNICVVGTLSSNATAVTRAPFLTTGGTIYLNGDMTHDATMRVASNTVLVLQGTGTWTESAITISTGNWGLTWQVQVNTTGTRTIGSLVGIRFDGSITYTAGTLIFSPGSGLYMNASSLYGFASAGIIIPTVKNVTSSAGTASTIYLYDTVPYQILDIEFVGGNGNFAWGVSGTVGFICDSLSCVLNSLITSTVIRLESGIEYIVRTNLSLLAWQPTNNFTLGAFSGTTIFTLLPGASQDLYYVNGGGGGTSVNSSNGQTIYTRSGFIASTTTNWKNWDYPKTRHSILISD
jgi:hypothetical protein